ncbi:MAG: PQQ-binding-like beta-propeller repeat protein, partial [Gammaproteobacteria bacterium]|nr:PQQ-binding-like beta-propeller repeat protein [Gammaproteobacteria bacterium]
MHSTVKTLALPWVMSLFLFGLASSMGAYAQVTHLNAAATYHYDALRTGWDRQEQILSAANFPATFGVQKVVTLDDQVDGQPLYVAHQRIQGKSHDVVYVATESNTVYALDAASGAILAQRNLGPPVPSPLGCTNNGPNVGINSTPVIDLGAQRMYVIAYINGAAPTYQIFALSLGSLADAVPPVTVTASHRLTDGSTYTFNATVQ